MQRKPGDGHNQGDLDNEQEVDVAQVEVIPENNDAQEVNNGCSEQSQEHLPVKPVDLSIHVQNLDDNEGGEGDGDDIDEGVVEELH